MRKLFGVLFGVLRDLGSLLVVLGVILAAQLQQWGCSVMARVGCSAANVPRRCPTCNAELQDGYCDDCGYDADDDTDADFDRDELGDDPEED